MSKNIVIVLLLLFLYPVGLFLMWLETKWVKWVKIILSLPLILMILAIPMAISLIAINPARQFADSYDIQRKSDVNFIADTLGVYKAENGAYPSEITTNTQEISLDGADICNEFSLNNQSLPVDPKISGADKYIKDCSSAYKTGYTVSLDINGVLTVTAPNTQTEKPYSVTR